MTRPNEPMSPKVRRLLAEAKEARQLRDALTDPDVVALKGEKVRRIGETLLWVSISTFLIFTIITVHDFVNGADGHPGAIGSSKWSAAWFLEPAIITGLIAVLIWEGFIVRQRVRIGIKAKVAKWGLLAATYTMNTWMAWTDAFAGITIAPLVFHSIPPLAVFWLTEAREETLDKIEEAVLATHLWSVRRRRERHERLKQSLAEETEFVASIGTPDVPHAPVVSTPEPPSQPSVVPSIGSPFVRPAPVPSAAPPLFQAVPNVAPRYGAGRVTEPAVSPQTSRETPQQHVPRAASPTPREGAPSMSYVPNADSSHAANGNGTVSTVVAPVETETRTPVATAETLPVSRNASTSDDESKSTGRPRNPDTEKQRKWIHDQLDAGKPVTGTMVDNKFGNTSRNGSRLVRSVKNEREKNGKN